MKKLHFIVIFMFLFQCANSRASTELDISINNGSNKIDPYHTFNGMIEGRDGSRGYGKAVKFTLSNTGGSIVVVDNLYVEILEAKPDKIYTFPTGPLAPLNRYEFTVYLDPSKKIIPITKNQFKYKQGDIDNFVVHIKSEHKYLYKFRIVAEGYDVITGERYIRKSKLHQASFPEVVSYIELLNNAKESIDIYLSGQRLSGLLMSAYSVLLQSNARIRVITDRDFFYGAGMYDRNMITTKHKGEMVIGSSSSLISRIGANSFRALSSDELFNNYTPYIIIDNSIVLANETDYLLGKVSFYDKGNEVSKFIDHFNQKYPAKNYLSIKFYQKIFGNFDTENVFNNFKYPKNLQFPTRKTRYNEYLYLLRFNVDVKSISILKEEAVSDNLKNKEQAISSLKYIESKIKYDDKYSILHDEIKGFVNSL